MGAAQLADTGRTDARQEMLSLTDLSTITNAQDFTSIAQPLNSAGTQIPIKDSIAGRLYGVADNF